MIEMTIDRIGVSLNSYQRVVILKEKDAERRLIIWIGPAEAESIAIKMQNVRVPRPLTHDLLNTVIPELGGEIRHILISDLKDDTFFAQIVVRHGEKDIEVDSRPSDAVALAVRAEVPIYAADDVLNEAGVLVNSDTGDYVFARDADGSGRREVTEEELRKLSAFRDFVEELNLEGDDKSGVSDDTSGVSDDEARKMSAFSDAVEEIDMDLEGEQRKE